MLARIVFFVFVLIAFGIAGKFDYEDHIEPKGPCTWSSSTNFN